MMIDPTQITNYNLSKSEAEEFILFWVCAAGKNGVTSAKCLDKLLSAWREKIDGSPSPFEIVRYIYQFGDLVDEMKKHGIGCYNSKAKTFISLVNSNLDLKKCSVEDLESISGIGPKTARCFLIHSRPDQQYAGLDTHVLKFLKDKGHEVPKSTPNGKKYRELEVIFLKYVSESGMNTADFDLKIWNNYRNRKKSGMSVKVRYIKSSDFFAVSDIENDNFSIPWKIKDFKIILKSKKNHGLVAEINDELVGYIVYHIEQDQLKIINMSVATSFRRNKVGSFLIQKLILELSKSNPNRKKISLTVSDKNIFAHLFFKSLGFKAIGVTKSFFGLNHDGYDFVYQSLVDNKQIENCLEKQTI